MYLGIGVGPTTSEIIILFKDFNNIYRINSLFSGAEGKLFQSTGFNLLCIILYNKLINKEVRNIVFILNYFSKRLGHKIK